MTKPGERLRDLGLTLSSAPAPQGLIAGQNGRTGSFLPNEGTGLEIPQEGSVCRLIDQG